MAQNSLSAGNPLAAAGEGSRAEPTAGTASTAARRAAGTQGQRRCPDPGSSSLEPGGSLGFHPAPAVQDEPMQCCRTDQHPCNDSAISIPSIKGCSSSHPSTAPPPQGSSPCPTAVHPALTARGKSHWEKPAHGNCVLHNINWAHRRTTALP